MKITNNFGLAIHGGTASFTLDSINESCKKLFENFFTKLIESGYKNLERGYTSLEIVEEVICKLEDSGLFNAGRGSIIFENGFPSMDASIMNGQNINYGSITSISNIKNPISLAKKIMEIKEGCYSISDITDSSLFSKHITPIDKNYFNIEKLWFDLIKGTTYKKASTVGCVVLDKNGDVAAGTSTGGLIRKIQGRISDSSYLGASTYANNDTGAISCSGHGETIIKTLLAHSVHSKISLLDLSMGQAIDLTFEEHKDKFEYNIGLIGIDKMGNIYVKFNSNMMFYAYKSINCKYQSTFYKN